MRRVLMVLVGMTLVAAFVSCSSDKSDDSSSSSTTKAHDSSGSDCQAEGTTIPDGEWNGEITFDTQGTASGASGSVQSTGGGELDLVVEGGDVTGTSWSMNATSTGTISTSGASGTIDGSLELTDGTVSGTADAVKLAGSAVLTGKITVMVSGVSVDTPLDGTFPTTSDLTIEQVSCDEVVATFIPSFNQQAGGVATFTGTARWTGHPA